MANLIPTTLIVLPDVIVKPGRYRTRGGEVVSVEGITKGHFGCQGFYANGTAERWHKSGRLYFGTLSDNDIVTEVTCGEGAGGSS